MLVSKRSIAIGESLPKIDSDRWTVDVSATHDGYPAAKLQTDNLDDAARTWGQRRSHTTITGAFTITGSTTINIDYVSLLGMNRRGPDKNLYPAISLTPNEARLIIDTVPAEVYLPEVQSFAFATTNLTGTYDILNQVLNPPEETLAGGYAPARLTKVSNSANTVVELAFQSAYQAFRPLKEGANLQEILIHVRDSVSITTFPTLTVVLRQYVAGVWSDVATLTLADAEKTSEGYILTYRYDAAILPSNIEKTGLRITGTTTGTSTPEYFAVVFRAAVDGTLYDSGWQTITKPESVTWLPAIETSGSEIYVVVQFSDFVIQSFYGMAGSVTIYSYAPMPEALTIGRFLAGEAIDISLLETGFNPRKSGNNQGALSSTYGGFLRANRSDLTRWEVGLNCEPQPQSRLFGELNALFKDVGFVLPLLYIITETGEAIDSAALFEHPIFWALITSWEDADRGLQTVEGVTNPYLDLLLNIIEVNAHATRRSE